MSGEGSAPGYAAGIGVDSRYQTHVSGGKARRREQRVPPERRGGTQRCLAGSGTADGGGPGHAFPRCPGPSRRRGRAG